MLLFTLSIMQVVWQTTIFPIDPYHPWLKHTAQTAQGGGALEPDSTFTVERLARAVLRKQERWDILLLFWCEVLVHITLHHQCKLFSTAILGFYLHSDLANYFVAFLYKAFIFCIPEVAQKSRVRTDKRSTYTVKSLELCWGHGRKLQITLLNSLF